MWRRMRQTNLAPLSSCHAPEMTRQRAGERDIPLEKARPLLSPKHRENQQPDEALAGVIKANS